MSLANFYRPQHFKTVIGQEHIIPILQAQVQNEKQRHYNYLFFGPRGTGKTTTARVFAKALNCINPTNGNPCNTCANCETINKQNSLDYVEIDAASHTGVDNIREEILDKSLYPPTQLKKKIYVIDEVHMLSKGAFNALLKTIEEPQPNVCFILATTEIHKIPETIISRCQVFNFKKVPAEEMINHLKNICKQEEIRYEDEALVLIATMSEGCVRDAVKYVDQVSILGEITQAHVASFLSVAPTMMITNFLETIKKADRNEIFAYIDTLHEQAIDLHNFVKQIILYIDQHLLEDIDFLLNISQICTEILQTIKYYPYPTIVYKIAINNYIQKNNSSINSVTIPPVIQSQTQEQEEKKPQVKTTIATQATSIPQSIKQEESMREEAKDAREEAKDAREDAKEEKKAESLKTDSIPTTGGVPSKDTEYTTILQTLLERIDKPSLVTTIKEHVIIDTITDTQIHMVVINKMTHLIISKQETIDYLQGLLSDITNKQLYLHITFEKKEDYFQRKLS